jgi:2-hydroxy-6-oxonona-2,4-dienedioate hydrolase
MKTETGTVELKDGKIYYEVAGEGETLVLSHAGFVDSGMWDDQWQVFTEKYRVIRYDMRGYGKSSMLDAPVVRRDDLHKLLDHLKVENAHLLGCSMGGEIVIDYTLEHSERVLSLIAVSAVPSGFQMQGKPPDELMQMMEAAQKGDLKRESELQIRVWVDGPFRQPDQVDADVRNRAAKMNKIPVENSTFMKADAQPLKPLNPPAAGRLSSIKVPVLKRLYGQPM